MERIKEYIVRFFANKEMDDNYDMKVFEWRELVNSKQSRCDIIATTFNFGYVKGYRAAMAEMNKVDRLNSIEMINKTNDEQL